MLKRRLQNCQEFIFQGSGILRFNNGGSCCNVLKFWETETMQYNCRDSQGQMSHKKNNKISGIFKEAYKLFD